MRKYAIITAAGKSARFGANKALTLLGGKPVLIWSVEIFSKFVDEMIVTIPAELKPDFTSLLSSFHKVKFISGGETRYQSVRNAFDMISEDGIVLIHDAARPLISSVLVERVLRETETKKAVIPVIPIPETVKEVVQDRIVKTLSRDQLALAQTPQGFHVSVLRDAYARVQTSDFTDEAMLAELAGIEIFTVPGDVTNLKITQPSDLTLAEFYLQRGKA